MDAEYNWLYWMILDDCIDEFMIWLCVMYIYIMILNVWIEFL